MIKIIKKGKIQPKKVVWYKVKCPDCGTEFYATEDEFENISVARCLESDPRWRPPLGTIRCPNEECHLHEEPESFSYILHNPILLSEGEEPDESKD